LAGKRFRKNEQIRLPEIFLVSETGEKIGKIATRAALEKARQKGLDLVEVAPNARPPVCRIMDFGNFLYEQKKKEKSQKKAGKTEIKGVRFGIRISDHDLETKLRAVKKFLEKGHPIKATLQFRGREIVHTDLGFAKMNEFAEKLAEYAKIEQPPKKQGRQIVMILSPQKTAPKKSNSDTK